MSDATLSPAARAALVRLLRAAYPHPDFPDGPYERAAEAVVTATAEDLWHRLSLAEGLRTVTVLLHPYLPASADKLLDALGVTGEDRLAFDGAAFGSGPTGTPVGELAPLFPKPE